MNFDNSESEIIEQKNQKDRKRIDEIVNVESEDKAWGKSQRIV